LALILPPTLKEPSSSTRSPTTTSSPTSNDPLALSFSEVDGALNMGRA
jgi:hypothetical protein